MLMFIGAADHKNSSMESLIWIGPTVILLLAYLGYFSVLKFRRVRTESDQFEKMQK